MPILKDPASEELLTATLHSARLACEKPLSEACENTCAGQADNLIFPVKIGGDFVCRMPLSKARENACARQLNS